MPSLITKTKREFEKHAKESLDVISLGCSFYAFGSELACLRLERAYRYCGDRAAANFSENRNSWYFRLETLYNVDGETS